MKFKMTSIQKLAALLLFFMQIMVGNQSLLAAQEESEEDILAKAQAQMNADVLSKPFLAEKPEEVDAYIKSMLEKKATPAEYQGSYWRSGYTCRDLLRYDWTQYRNCKYYYRYHGRYYY